MKPCISRLKFLETFIINGDSADEIAYEDIYQNHYWFSDPLGLFGLILSQFENIVPLGPVLGGVSSVL